MPNKYKGDYLINKFDVLQLLNVLEGVHSNGDPIWIKSYLSKVILKILKIKSNEKLPNFILQEYYEGKITRHICFNKLIGMNGLKVVKIVKK